MEYETKLSEYQLDSLEWGCWIAYKTTGIQVVHQRKLQLILARLDAIHQPEDMNLPGFDFHKLSGDMKGCYAVSVNKNWRIVFKFDGTDACAVDYIDYH